MCSALGAFVSPSHLCALTRPPTRPTRRGTPQSKSQMVRTSKKCSAHNLSRSRVFQPCKPRPPRPKRPWSRVPTCSRGGARIDIVRTKSSRLRCANTRAAAPLPRCGGRPPRQPSAHHSQRSGLAERPCPTSRLPLLFSGLGSMEWQGVGWVRGGSRPRRQRPPRRQRGTDRPDPSPRRPDRRTSTRS
jgi:hypothetical protein